MEIQKPHHWPSTLKEAQAIQESLRNRVITVDQLPETIQYVAGVDMGFLEAGTISRAAVAVLRFPKIGRAHV